MIQTTTAPLVFLDVNLRPPWWDQAGVLQRVKSADWVKLNSDELTLLAGGSASGWLAEYGLAGVIETRGAEGALAWTTGGEHAAVMPDAAIELIDTVGAGDAFTAVAILGIISGWPLSLTLERAQRFASLIVGRRGATVDERAFYAPLLEAWELNPAAVG
jgi:fructokinase